MSAYRRGAKRENELAEKMRENGWVTYRSHISRGNADLVCLRAGQPPLLVQVKTDKRGPYANFGPAEREALRLEALDAGAVAQLCWWAPDRKGPRFFGTDEWPPARG